MTKFLNISTDNTLGGNSPSDVVVSSQKALKEYIDANSGGASDGTTINKNSSNQLQAIGVINKNTANGATNPKYDWVGTLAEYNAQSVATAHPDWICYITDDVSGGTSVYTKAETDTAIAAAISTMLGSVYPVGSTYIGTTSTCPMASLISGSTWTLVSSGRVLQGADSGHSAGTTIEAGLPNIEGAYSQTFAGFSEGSYSGIGAITKTSQTSSTPISTSSGASILRGTGFTFAASRSNSIYGNSTTVQPPAYVVNIWERTA